MWTECLAGARSLGQLGAQRPTRQGQPWPVLSLAGACGLPHTTYPLACSPYDPVDLTGRKGQRRFLFRFSVSVTDQPSRASNDDARVFGSRVSGFPGSAARLLLWSLVSRPEHLGPQASPHTTAFPLTREHAPGPVPLCLLPKSPGARGPQSRCPRADRQTPHRLPHVPPALAGVTGPRSARGKRQPIVKGWG